MSYVKIHCIYHTPRTGGGEDLADAIAGFVEKQSEESLKGFATKEDLIRELSKLREEVKLDNSKLRDELKLDSSKLREELKTDGSKLREGMARLEASIVKEIANRYNILVAVLTALGVILALLNKFL